MNNKILIVDDDANIRELVQMTLEDEGYEMHEATDGLDALKKAREIKPAVMILDVMMSEKSGYEVCEELKHDPETKGIFIIFLTARGSLVSEITGKKKGGDDFLPKPFESAVLKQKIRNAISRK